ncbi:universal stress protein [Oceanisphaera avium]|uniref:Usp domain-containing protein n=1 Tax=Oceanisphaera avium TaxID=1903694 RepID=A0A1Y0CW28_9GAMM|nr:universal stress protein [Oceanisphaera avium]ART79224.1 Usp domain-containing protein [Oceanisphaera avium]
MKTNVLACIDGSLHTATVCDYAAWASSRLGASLVLLNIIPKSEPTLLFNISGAASLTLQDNVTQELADLDKKREALAKAHSRQILDQASLHISDSGYPVPRTVQRVGRLVDEIEQYDDYCQLLVLGRQGANDDEDASRLGSHVEHVIRTTDKPLLLTWERFKDPKKVMLAFDASETCRKGVDMLASSTLFKGIECHLVMVADPDPQNLEQLEVARLQLEVAGLKAVSALLQGEVKKHLLNYQQQHDIDIVIMGAYGHSRIRQWLLGSITDLMLQESSCTLLILK